MPHTATATSSAAAAPLSTRSVPLTRWWLIALGLTLLWDWMGADLAVMQLIGSPSGFALRDQWLLSRVLHDAVRQADQFDVETVGLVECFLAMKTHHRQAQAAVGQGQGKRTFLVIEHSNGLCQAIRA